MKCKRLASLTGIVLTGFVLTAPATAQLDVLEDGYCVYVLPPSSGAKQLECSPGGVWGDFVYVGDSAGGAVERIDYSDNVTTFATGLSFPVGLEFGPGPAADFGNFLYVSDFGSGLLNRVDPSGVVSFFATVGPAGSNTFDPSGAYGTDMFLAQAAFIGPIVTVDAVGLQTFFSPLASTYIKFGPGGTFGSGMYSTDQGINPGIYTVDSLGIPTLFSGGFATPEGFDWASGAGWNGDMFATDVAAGGIWRVDPSGTRTLFATLPNAADVAFCNGDLYVVSADGGCFRIRYTPASDTFRNSGTNPVSYTSNAPVLGEVFSGDVDLTTTGHSSALVVGFQTPLDFTLGGGQTLLVNVGDAGGELFGFTLQSGTSVNFSAAVSSDVALCGFRLSSQAVHIGGVTPFALSNAKDLVVGL